MQDELPLALVKEQAEGEISGEKRREDGDGDGFDEPDGIDSVQCSGSTVVWLGGARHRASVLTLAPRADGDESLIKRGSNIEVTEN